VNHINATHTLLFEITMTRTSKPEAKSQHKSDLKDSNLVFKREQ